MHVRRRSFCLVLLPGFYLVKSGMVGAFHPYVNESDNERNFFYGVAASGQYLYIHKNARVYCFADAVVSFVDMLDSAKILSAMDSMVELSFIRRFSSYDRVLYMLRHLATLPDMYMTHPKGRLLTLSRFEIADLTGVSREVVGRALKKFHEAGILICPDKKQSIVLLETYGSQKFKHANSASSNAA